MIQSYMNPVEFALFGRKNEHVPVTSATNWIA